MGLVLMTTTDADNVAYCTCMLGVRTRLRLVRSILSHSFTTGDAGFDAEFACLQIRKSLELVAFGALSASRERYSEVHSGVTSEWKAKQIFERLERIHPDFYPVPVSHVVQPGGKTRLDPLPDGFLTKDEFTFLYDKCSEAIHSWNPLRPGPPVVQLDRPLDEWVDRIERLLNLHFIRLVGQPDLLVVYLSYPPDGRVRAFTGSPQESEEDAVSGDGG